jgi:glutamine amidotransferase
MIAVVDAGLGNLRSVEKALLRAGGDAQLTSDPARVAAAERLVVPGQGHFGDGARALARQTPLGDAVASAIARGAPYLGICLGLQLLFDESEEAPGAAGLGLFAGRVEKIPAGLREPETDAPLKVPHVGWNEVAPSTGHPLLAGAPAPFYFVHSYHAAPRDPSLVAATCRYGARPLVAAVARDNVFAVQFHPEKSQRAGLDLLAAFVAWKP